MRARKSPPAKDNETTLRLPIAALAADPKNPRRISDEAQQGLAVSLETFGQQGSKAAPRLKQESAASVDT